MSITAEEARALSESGELYVKFYATIDDKIREAAMAGKHEVRLTCSWKINDCLLLQAADELMSRGFVVHMASREEIKAMNCAQYWDRDFIIKWEVRDDE